MILPNILVTADKTIPFQIVNDRDSVTHLHNGHIFRYAVECDVILEDDGIS